MIEVIFFSVGLLVAVVFVIAARRTDDGAWSDSLVRYRLRFSVGIKPEQIGAWLAGFEPASSRSFFNAPGLLLETDADQRGISHYLLVPKPRAEAVLGQLSAAMPGVRYDVAEVEKHELNVKGKTVDAVELRLRSAVVPLGVERAEVSATAILASLQPLKAGEVIRLQWILAGGVVPSFSGRERTISSFLDEQGLQDSDRLRARRRKHTAPLIRGIARIEVTASSIARARQLRHRVTTAYTVMDSPGATIRRRRLPSWWVSRRLQERTLSIGPWPLLLNAEEAAGLIGLPVGELELPGLTLGVARQLAAPQGALRRGVLVGRSDHPSSAGRALRIGTAERLQHLHVIGPTGTGKSTLLANLALQDIERGRGVVVIDPKRDLVEAILVRIPEKRLDDVVVLDPVDVARPVGLNVLAHRGDETSRELAAEQTLGVLQRLFSDSWGPRTDDVLRSSLMTLTSVPAPDGSAFTLCEVPELLVNPALRGFVLRSSSVPASLRSFRGWFESISEAERATIIGPSLNKLRAFTTRTPIHLMLGQSEGFDIKRVFTEKKILLVPLSSGELGRPVAELLGALIVSKLWSTIRSRTAIAPERRHPVFVYLDEFQDILRLPVDIADLLAQARGLGVGLTLAHQHIAQLPPAIRAGVLNTARSRIVFQLSHDDAKVIAAGMAPLTSADLEHLEAYSVALRTVDGGQVLRPVTAVTEPLDAAVSGLDVRGRGRHRHGVDRRDVEAALGARVELGAPATSFGRRRVEDPEVPQ